MLKRFSALLLAFVLAFTLAACSSNSGKNEATNSGGSNSGSNATSKDNDSKDKPVKQTVIKILHWKQQNINDVIKEINKQFEDKYPEYRVEYTTTAPDDEYKQAMRSRLTAGDVDIFPDLSGMRLSPQDWSPGAQVPYWQEFIDNGLIADLSDQAFVKNYSANDIKNAGTYKGKVYAIPAGSVAMSGFFYNKDIFAANNLKVPTTWTEFINVCETLKNNGITPIALAGKDVWPLKLPVFGLQAQILAGGNQQAWIEGLWKGTNHFNDPDAVEVLEKMKTIQDKYTIDGFMGIDYTTLPSYFATSKVAMIADGTWDAPTLKQANGDLNFGYFPIPGTEDPAKNHPLIGKYDMTWYVANNGPNTEGAMKWLEFYSQPEIYSQFVKAAGFLPTQPNIKTDSKFIDEEIIPHLDGFQLAYEILLINRENVGEHIAAEGVHTEYLAPNGEFTSAKALADVQQQEWDAAAPK